MNYAEIKYNDIANGLGVRTSLFVSGCRNNCPGCFNKEAQNFTYGNLFTKKQQNEIIESMDEYHHGITLLGGDPFEPENVFVLNDFLIYFRDKCPDKSVWVYTGYTFEKLLKEFETYDSNKNIFKRIDILVDGLFIEELKDISLDFRGSSNQRIIDVQKSLKENKTILFMK